MTTPTCTFVQGDVQKLTRQTSASAAITAGDILTDGDLTLVAHCNVQAGDPSELAYDGGIYDVVKAAGTDFTLGDRVHVDFSTGLAVTAPTANSKSFGICARTTPTNATTVRCTHAQAVGYTTTVAGSMTADDITGSDANLSINGKAGTAGGAGGQITSAGGAGDTNGAGGAVSYKGGAGAGTGAGGAASYGGGASGTGATGNGGATTHRGGAALSTNGNGGAGTYGGGDAAGTGTGGASTFTSGASAGAGGTAGALAVDTGAANGGTAGALTIGTANAGSVTIGKTSVGVSMPGPLTAAAGASTAAAGTTTADAGVLPAGTARVYPTTAADDTKGVRVHASDKVTGRTIFIGNGVSNKILKVYGPSGAAINGAAADAAFSSASGKGVIMHCLDSTANTWLAW